MRAEKIKTSGLAERLGFDATYVWRVLNGERSGVSPNFLAAVEGLLNQPVTVVGSATSWIQLDDALSRAVQAFQSGQLSASEAMFVRVYETAGDSPIERYVAAKAKQWRAGILRDRNVLRRNRSTGEPGAIELYTEAIGEWRSVDPGMIIETRFMLAACQEMLRRNDVAVGEYLSMETEAKDPWLKARLAARTGAILTKMGELVAAGSRLDRAVRVASHLDESGPYAFAQEKLAIWLIRKGDLDAASAALDRSASAIPHPSALRKIQALVVRSDLKEQEGQLGQAIELLEEAERICAEVSYAHQASIVSARLRDIRRLM